MRIRVVFAILLIALLGSLALAVVGQAQTSTNYDLSWRVIGAGGRGMGSASYALGGTLGQPLAGRTQSDSHLLSQGYWYPVSLVQSHRVHLPIIVR
jgi:hypothetical protein